MKKILLVLFSVMIITSLFVNVFTASASTVSDAEGGVEELDISFDPAGFLTHIDKMILGMIGIFIVVGVVILLTYLLNRITAKK